MYKYVYMLLLLLLLLLLLMLLLMCSFNRSINYLKLSRIITIHLARTTFVLISFCFALDICNVRLLLLWCITIRICCSAESFLIHGNINFSSSDSFFFYHYHFFNWIFKYEPLIFLSVSLSLSLLLNEHFLFGASHNTNFHQFRFVSIFQFHIDVI